MSRERLESLLRLVAEELHIMQSTLQDKGRERFGRTVVIVLILVLGSYQTVYKAPQRQMARLRADLAKARLLAGFADEYTGLRDRVRELNASVPGASRENETLTDTLVDAMKAENIIPDSITPPEQWTDGGFGFKSVNIIMTVRFEELIGWLRRMEEQRPVMHVSKLQIMKDKSRIGIARVTCVVTTGLGAEVATP